MLSTSSDNHMDLPADCEKLNRMKRFGAVPMDLEVELHHTTITVRELLDLHPGSVIRTDKRANAALTLRVGGAVVARGELSRGKGKRAVRVKSFGRKGPA
jgi:flagellar motor switch protein FliN